MPEKNVINIWLTLDKLRAAIYRLGINLWDYFREVVPVKKSSLISESDFVKILCCLQKPLGLKDKEIEELTDYFRVPDGRVLYAQFCQTIHDAPDPKVGTGEDFEGNPLHMLEERRLRVLLTKIATVVNERKLILKPYTQDFELISKKSGSVTIAHFARALSFMGVNLCPEEFVLLRKKFGKDSYNVDYVAFLKALAYVTKYLKNKDILDLGGDLLQQWPGRSWLSELPALPRPEWDPCCAPRLQDVLPLMQSQEDQIEIAGVVQKIRKHVFESGIQAAPLFKEVDYLDSGRITVAQFRDVLETLSRLGCQRLWISGHEMDFLICIYKDPTDPVRICYKLFLKDIEQICSREIPDPKLPCLQQDTQEQETEKPKEIHWWEIDDKPRDFFKETMDNIKKRLQKRHVDLKPTFNDYDRKKMGHVRREEFHRTLLSNGLLVSPEELAVLEDHYMDDMGFNYFRFVNDLHTTVKTCCPEEPKEEKPPEKPTVCEPPSCYPPTERKDRDIIEILAKLKNKVNKSPFEVCSKFKRFDPENTGSVCCPDFVNVVAQCGFDLTDWELQTLLSVYKDKNHPNKIAYMGFCEEVEGIKSCSETLPLVSPLRHKLINDCLRTFLNFEERQCTGMALEKLADKPGAELMSVFVLYDPENKGTIPSNKLSSVFHRRGLMVSLSSRELECLAKAFTYDDKEEEVDYRALCRSLELLYVAKYRKPSEI